MIFSFNRKKLPLLGIDISSAAVKLLELGHTAKGYHVESFAVEPLPMEAVVDKNIVDLDIVGNAVKAVVKQSGTRLKHAAVAVAGSAVITKVITMSASLTPEEMEGQIQLEADQYIPYSLDEVNLDFDVIGPNEKQPEMVDVLLAASRSENVDDRVAALEMGGLKAKIVDVEAYAIESTYPLLIDQLPDGAEDFAVAIADTGATVTTLNVIENNRIIYTREQGFGGKQLTEEIQRRFGLSYEEAGLAKKHGGLPDSYLSEVLDPFKHAMVKQVGSSLQFFTSSSAHRGVDCVLLAGGCASIPGIDTLMEGELGVHTVVANPFINMTLANRIKQQNLSNDAPAMVIACGLALRGFD